MRRHGLLLLLVLFSAPAAARSPIRPHLAPLSAAIEPGLHAGTLVLTFHNHSAIARPLVIDHGYLTVELTHGNVKRTLRFTGARENVTIPALFEHVERIDLDAHTADLPPRFYDVLVTWQSPELETVVHTSTSIPYRCGLAYAAPPPPSPPPSRLPYALGALTLVALLVGWRLAKPGTTDARVPHSAP